MFLFSIRLHMRVPFFLSDVILTSSRLISCEIELNAIAAG